MRIRIGVAVAGVLLTLAGCGSVSGGGTTPVSRGAWEELPVAPLSPRASALAVWTGTELLVVGGSDDEPCPANADCPIDPTPLADGAAYDPAKRSWRPIAGAPAGLLPLAYALAGRTLYVVPYAPDGEPTHLLAYRIDDDRWETVPAPGNAGWLGLAGAGDRLVAYLGSHENVDQPDLVLDEAGRWQPLPPSPLGAGFDRRMEWAGERLVLFDRELVPNPGAEKPSVVRAATLDLATGAWTRLRDSEIISGGPWLLDSGALVNPSLGGADGGKVNGWGRWYANGGRLDVAAGAWSPLPGQVPPESAGRPGVRGAAGALYQDPSGPILDLASGGWQAPPPLPGGRAENAAVVAAGRDMVVFGGAVDGTLTEKAWRLPAP